MVIGKWTIRQFLKSRLIMAGLAVACLVLSSCDGAFTFRSAAEMEEAERYRVYSVMLNELFVVRGEDVRVLTINSKTSENTAIVFGSERKPLNAAQLSKEVYELRTELESADPETLVNYVCKRHDPEKVEAKFSLPVKVEMVDIDVLTKDRNGSVYTAFKERYPNKRGYITLSNIGFNRSRTEALVNVIHHCFGLCGSEYTYLLEKRSGYWKFKDSRLLWIS